MPTLGIDIGGSSVKAALVDGRSILLTRCSGQYKRPDRAQLVAAIAQATEGIPPIEAIGVCVPGLLDRDRQTVTLSVNVPGAVGTPLRELLAQSVGAGIPSKLTIATDAHAAGYDIHASRHLEGRLLVVSLGTGVGAAVLDDGVALHVDGESPGHLGQMDVGVSGHPVVGPDGGAGSLEGYIGSPAIVSSYNMDPREVIGGWRGAEPEVAALVRALRICHAIYRPQHICLAGGLGVRMGHLVGSMRAQIASGLTRIAREGWTLSVGDDDLHAARGVARMAAL